MNNYEPCNWVMVYNHGAFTTMIPPAPVYEFKKYNKLNLLKYAVLLFKLLSSL